MMRAAAIESAIRAELIRQGPCALQALLDRLPQFSWSEVFAVIDRLSREGRLVLRHPTRFDYQIAVGPALEQPAEGSDDEGNAVLSRVDVGSRVYEERTPA